MNCRPAKAHSQPPPRREAKRLPTTPLLQHLVHPNQQSARIDIPRDRTTAVATSEYATPTDLISLIELGQIVKPQPRPAPHVLVVCVANGNNVACIRVLPNSHYKLARNAGYDFVHESAISSSVLPFVSGSSVIPKINAATQKTAESQKTPAMDPIICSENLAIIGKK